MKYFIIYSTLFAFLLSCGTSKNSVSTTPNDTLATQDTIKIANEELEYEILIIEEGFNQYLITQPQMEYYELPFLEGRNKLLVSEYNRRVANPNYPYGLYPQQIFYDPNVNYGKEVNFLLFNYFEFFQQRYNQKLR